MAIPKEGGGSWFSIDALRRLWFSDDQEDSRDTKLEGVFEALSEDLVDAITGSSSERLLAGHHALRQLYLAIGGYREQETQSIEGGQAFGTGRLVGLLDVASGAVRRVLVEEEETELIRTLDDKANYKLIQELQRSQGRFSRSSDLVATTGLDKAVVSRQLDLLEARGLVATRRLGKFRLSRLTSTGMLCARRYDQRKRRPLDDADLGDKVEAYSKRSMVRSMVRE